MSLLLSLLLWLFDVGRGWDGREGKGAKDMKPREWKRDENEERKEVRNWIELGLYRSMQMSFIAAVKRLGRKEGGKDGRKEGGMVVKDDICAMMM
jgi:hypothetical protein